jgi:hypothetical protein
MAELTITLPYVHSTPTHLPMGSPLPESTLTYARVDFILQSVTSDLASGPSVS